MNGSFAALEDAGKIERIPSGRAEVERLHSIVARDVETANELHERHRDWALTSTILADVLRGTSGNSSEEAALQGGFLISHENQSSGYLTKTAVCGTHHPLRQQISGGFGK